MANTCQACGKRSATVWDWYCARCYEIVKEGLRQVYVEVFNGPLLPFKVKFGE